MGHIVHFIKLTGFFIPFALCLGCGGKPPQVYRMSIEQGNVFDSAQVKKLKKGQTKTQVLEIMGTPLVKNAFRGNRWDYVYRYKKGQNNRIYQKQVVLHFKNKRLAKIELPAEIGQAPEK